MRSGKSEARIKTKRIALKTDKKAKQIFDRSGVSSASMFKESLVLS
jgi:hypothetical protein